MRLGRLMLRLPGGALEAITAGEVFAPSAGARLMARELVFAPLGGVGEIGMNLALYGIGEGNSRKWIAVDLGVSFAGEELPGIDLIMPDIAFLIAERRNLLGARSHPRARRPLRRGARSVAAAALPGLCDAIHGFAAGREARG